MSDGGSFSMGFANAYRMMMDREEKRKEQQASKAYFDMLAQDAQAKIQPITDAATRAQFGANWADSNVAAANAPITTAPDKLADTRSLRFLSMTPEERTRAGITPEQSAQMDKSMQAEGPVNMQQANAGVAQTLAPIAQQADNQAAQTQAMLQQAQQRYGTEMFGKLGALVENGMDPRMAMKIADNHIAKAEAAALKEQMRMNVKILSDKNANPEQKQAVLAQMMVDNPQAARGLAEAFGLKQQDPKLSIAPDGRVVDMRTGQPVSGAPSYRAPEKPTGQLTEYQRWQIENQQNKEPKKAEWEKEHHDYEKTHGMNDAQLVQEYWAMSQDPAQSALITPEKQAKYNVASARVNKYLAQPNLTKDEQDFLSSLDRSKLTQEQGFKMLQQYRMNKLNGIRQ